MTTYRERMRWAGILIAWSCILPILLAVGCEGKPRPIDQVSLRSIDGPGVTQAVEKHRGQVVLVDFWATWCGPCLELLPHAVKLHETFADRGLAVVTVNLDDPDRRSAVQKLLADQQATMDNYLSVYGVGPAAFMAFGIEDGALPHLRLYDRQGKLHRAFASGGNSLDAKEIEHAVAELLNDGG
jgi:thiol-disulfide isomerase/thioredoxin